MVKLITYRPGMGDPSKSPFCLKAMILLKMSGMNWEPEWAEMPSASPTGKLPALRVGDEIIPDSNVILDWLQAQGADMFPGLNPQEKAQAHMVIRLIEDSLRHGLTHDRWLVDGNWQVLREAIFGAMPTPLKLVLPAMIRKKVKAGLEAHGLTKLGKEERKALLGADLAALSAQLADKPYLFGEHPCAADASALAFLSAIDRLPVATPLRDMLRQDAGLMAYLDRGRAELFPPLEPAISAAA